MAKRRMKSNLYNFKSVKRKDLEHRNVKERLKDYRLIIKEYAEDMIREQASRCQDCGIPFCHSYGCPVENMIPDWNDLVYKSLWKEALELLHSTNNYPEITGKVCPAPCEDACTLNVGFEPVTIKNIELAIVEKGFKMGWIKPQLPSIRTGRSVAIIGSGPAGMAAAQDLNRKGHKVVVFEKDDKVGGFLRYGIPDYKLEKTVIDRRIEQLKEEGVEFRAGINIGKDIKIKDIKKDFDTVLIACGSRQSRDLPIKGRELKGIYFATDYLTQSNKRVDGVKIPGKDVIDTRGKNVVVIGGGDTGSDCIGTAKRQGAKNVFQVEILPMPPECRAEETPWPLYAKKLRTSTSHEEGCERHWNMLTKEFTGEDEVKSVKGIRIDWKTDDSGRLKMQEIPGTEFEFKADIVLLAMGFVHPEHNELIRDLDLELDNKGNIATDNFGYGKTSTEGVFAAGDAARGASLVVWAFAHARDVSCQIDEYLKNKK